MRIAVGSDHLGFGLKDEIVRYLTSINADCVDLGVASSDEIVDYPDVARLVTDRITSKDCDRGILICGTGIGMAIAANKVRGIYAALCHDVYSAERASKSNNANVLTVGALVIGVEAAKKIVETWLNSEFAGGRSTPKVEKIKQIEETAFNSGGAL